MVRLGTLCLSFSLASLSILGAWCQSPPSPPACVRACSDSAAQSASCSSSDVNCICNSNTFANDVSTCIVSNCSPADAATAVGYFEALCSGASSSSVSVSGASSTGSASTSASGSESGSVTGTASSSESSSGTSTSSPSSSESGLSSPTNPAEQSTVSSTTSGASQASTSHTPSSSSASSSAATPTTTPVSHAVHGQNAGSFGFALALAVALVAW